MPFEVFIWFNLFGEGLLVRVDIVLETLLPCSRVFGIRLLDFRLSLAKCTWYFVFSDVIVICLLVYCSIICNLRKKIDYGSIFGFFNDFFVYDYVGVVSIIFLQTHQRSHNFISSYDEIPGRLLNRPLIVALR